MNKNLYSKGKGRKKTQSFLLLVFLFLLATIIPPVIAEVSSPPPIVQTQINPSQLVTEAQALYQKQQFEAALPLWQQAAKGFAQVGDSLNQAMALSNLSLTNQQLGRWQAANTAIKKSLKLLNPETESNSAIMAQTPNQYPQKNSQKFKYQEKNPKLYG